jgi:hypothetical protein
VSFLRGAASDLLYPILPIFLTVTLGARRPWSGWRTAWPRSARSSSGVRVEPLGRLTERALPYADELAGVVPRPTGPGQDRPDGEVPGEGGGAGEHGTGADRCGVRRMISLIASTVRAKRSADSSRTTTQQ